MLEVDMALNACNLENYATKLNRYITCTTYRNTILGGTSKYLWQQ